MLHNHNTHMPFKSQAQRRKLFATDPALAREFARKTKKIKRLPERVKPRISS